MKSLGGMKATTRTDPMSVLRHVDPGPNFGPTVLADAVNKAFPVPMSTFTPLAPDATLDVPYPNSPLLLEICILKKLSALNSAKSAGLDMIPPWLLKENADLSALLVTDIINYLFAEVRLLQSLHLRPISLTPVLSKVAEEFVVKQYVKPAVFVKVDPRQFGTTPGSNTTEALINDICME